jgi:hypothetical protein
MKRIITVTLTAATLAFFAATVAAQQPLEYKVTVTAEVVKGSPNDHFMTFSAPVHLPNVTLGAGTYIFRFLGSSVIQVANAEGNEIYTMFFTTPIQRAVALDEYEVNVAFRSYQAPPRVSTIFLPNRLQGFEVMYEEARGDR